MGCRVGWVNSEGERRVVHISSSNITPSPFVHILHPFYWCPVCYFAIHLYFFCEYSSFLIFFWNHSFFHAKLHSPSRNSTTAPSHIPTQPTTWCNEERKTTRTKTTPETIVPEEELVVHGLAEHHRLVRHPRRGHLQVNKAPHSEVVLLRDLVRPPHLDNNLLREALLLRGLVLREVQIKRLEATTSLEPHGHKNPSRRHLAQEAGFPQLEEVGATKNLSKVEVSEPLVDLGPAHGAHRKQVVVLEVKPINNQPGDLGKVEGSGPVVDLAVKPNNHLEDLRRRPQQMDGEHSSHHGGVVLPLKQILDQVGERVPLQLRTRGENRK